MSRQIFPAPIDISSYNALQQLNLFLNRGLSNGQLNLSQTNTLPQGSIPPTLNGAFTYVSTTGDIQWDWTSQSIWYPNGTFDIPVAGSEIVVGLDSNTKYYFYPYWDSSLQEIVWIDNNTVTFPNIIGFKGNGTTGYATADTAVNGPPVFSVTIWAKMTAGDTTTQPYLELSSPNVLGVATNIFFQLYSTGGNTIHAYIWNGAAPFNLGSATTVLNDGFWHAITFTCAGVSPNTYTLYVDGNIVIGPTASPASFGALTNMYWHIGACNGAAGWGLTTNTYATAVLAEAAVWSVSVPSSQVVEQSQSGLNIGQSQIETAIISSGADSLWPLNETSGTSIPDLIGTNTGTYRGTVTLNQSSVVYGAVGTPAIAWTQTTFIVNNFWQDQGHVPLSSGAMFASTTSSGDGGGSGGGSGGGGGGCFSRDTLVKTKRGNVRFDELTTDDLVLTAKGTWKKIKSILTHNWTEPLRKLPLNGAGTPKHEVLSGFAERCKFWDVLGNHYNKHVACDGKVMDLEVDTDEDIRLKRSPSTERSYTLANGIVVHNISPSEK
jgi:hypothetical protein